MIDSTKILSAIPVGLRTPLLNSYQKIATNYFEHKWETSELNGGKFCEVVYSIVNGSITGTFPAKPSKPPDMVLACRALEKIPSDPGRIGDRSLRILIPRITPVLYEIRNNRGVGHVGGDVDPNFLDATAVYSMASWVLAEIIRIFHTVTTSEAQEMVDMLIERKHPIIWEVWGTDIKRILDPKMKKGDQVLVFLHHSPSWVSDNDLFSWVGHSNLSMFRTSILVPFHKSRLIEYDKKEHRSKISPLGATEVENRILKIE
jgi:hypothetical protein